MSSSHRLLALRSRQAEMSKESNEVNAMAIQSITIIGRRWFDKVNGNTYHSAEILIDGKSVHKVPITYGYGEQYVQSAGEWLHKQGLIKLARYSNGGGEMLWTYCKDKGITFYHSVSDGLKRDL